MDGSRKTSPRMLLHWSPRSPFVRKVMIAAHELALVERIDRRRTVVSMDAPNAALLTDNPLSKIPTLILDDGAILTDSVVICEYLDSLAGGGRLFPPVGPQRWVELTRHALANGLLDVLILWRNEREKPEGARTPAWLDAFQVKTTTSLAYFDREIEAMGAGKFGIAQITLGCALSYLDFRFRFLEWRLAYRRLAAWMQEFKRRPSVEATEVVDDS